MIEIKMCGEYNFGDKKKQNMMDQKWKEYFYIYVQNWVGIGREMNDLITKKRSKHRFVWD